MTKEQFEQKLGLARAQREQAILNTQRIIGAVDAMEQLLADWDTKPGLHVVKPPVADAVEGES